MKPEDQQVSGDLKPVLLIYVSDQRFNLDTPANNEARITAADFELLRLGNIVLNNQID